MVLSDKDLHFYEVPHGLIIYCEESKVKFCYHTLRCSTVDFDEIVPAYDTIGILKRGQSYKDLKQKIKEIFSQVPEFETPNDAIIHTIPILYENENSDLAYLSEELGLSQEEIIEIHSSSIYEVALIGFLPGFVYLSGLDERIHHARKYTPRMHVRKGSVGIAGHQTGIYPSDSPGGWQIIGITPLKMFDPSSANIVPFTMGSKLKFEPIAQEEFAKMNGHE